MWWKILKPILYGMAFAIVLFALLVLASRRMA
jgi:hypothetical protein